MAVNEDYLFLNQFRRNLWVKDYLVDIQSDCLIMRD